MPHKQGYSKATFQYNVKHMIRAGHSRRVALAASYATARKSAKKAHARPSWLRNK